MKTRNLYPAATPVDIGELKDNDPPIFEEVNEYLIPNAYINSNGYIFKNFKPVKETISYRHRDSVSFKNIISNLFLKKTIKIDRPAISIMSGWGENFYHFTLESLLKLYLLKEHLGEATVVFPKNTKQFHQEWIQILDLKDVTYIGDDEVLKTPMAISSTFPARDQNHHNLIIKSFRDWILNKVEHLEPIKNKKIFVGRKFPSKRNIINIEEVKAEIKKYDFEYLEMENYNLIEQINIFRNAEKIIAIHGAALSHLSFSAPGTKVCDLIHRDYGVYCFLKLSKILDIGYSLLLCEGEKNSKKMPGYQDLKVDINELSELIGSWQV